MNFKIYKTLFLFSLLVVGSCKEKVEEKKAVVLRPVKYEVVGAINTQNIRVFSGVARAGDEIDLSFRSSGIITQLNVIVGQQVKKGDLIGRLDNVQAKLAYEQAVSALNTAKSGMNTAKLSLDRIKSLYEKGSNSLSDYEKAKNSYQSAADQYESAKRNKSIQQTQINYGVIKAPKKGVIALKNSQLNENVKAGEVIAVLNAGNDVNVIVGLPENVINKTKLGMITSLSFSSIDKTIFSGEIIEIAPMVDVNSATYFVKINIINPTEDIKPGMATDVTFNFSKEITVSENSLIVPVKAVGEDVNGNYVFMITSSDNKTGVVKKKTIVIGALTAAGFKVEKGLSAGDKIATAGLQTLLDGQQVRLK